MGIKFLCPNGHKLNVKSYLGGKKAICPKCGARVLVPGAEQATAVADPGSVEGDSSVDSVDLSSQPHAAQPIAAMTPAAAGPLPEAPPAQPPDPIDEAPTAVWYVRPVTGGQFGPAPGEIMRAWIHAGRVGASSLVWRAGWPDWRSAAATFPQLASLLASPDVAFAVAKDIAPGHGNSAISSANGMPAQVGAPLPTGQVVHRVAVAVPEPIAAQPDTDMPPLIKTGRKRRHKSDVSVLASFILAGVSIILVIVVVLVFRNQNAPAEKEPEAHREVLLP